MLLAERYEVDERLDDGVVVLHLGVVDDPLTRRLRRGVFHSLVDLQAAINRYLAEHNTNPKPFVWTATTEKIMAKLEPLNASVH